MILSVLFITLIIHHSHINVQIYVCARFSSSFKIARDIIVRNKSIVNTSGRAVLFYANATRTFVIRRGAQCGRTASLSKLIIVASHYALFLVLISRQRRCRHRHRLRLDSAQRAVWLAIWGGSSFFAFLRLPAGLINSPDDREA